MDVNLCFSLLTLLILAPQEAVGEATTEPQTHLHLSTANFRLGEEHASGLSKTYLNYDYDYYYQEPGVEPPTFMARPQTFTVEVGQSVIIPCDVENPSGRNKLIIKKQPASGGSEKLLSVGSDKVTPDPRIDIKGSRLTISHTRPRDAGTFLCQFDLEPPVQLRHTLDVQFAPTVRALVPPEQHVAKGNSVTLECKANGNPEPNIRWSHQEGRLPSGYHTSQGPRLTLENVDRRAEGTYLCTADNGIGEPASAAMSITVEYPPEVVAEKTIVRTGEDDNVELVCIVHGRPAPEVVWTRDGQSLPDSIMDTKLHQPRTHTAHDAHMTQNHVAHRHILSIKPVTEKDFGSYVCIAENDHGKESAVIQMTGLPKPPVITSSPNGGESDSYTFTMETESYYPITEFIIKYRKTHPGAWHRNYTVMAGKWRSFSKIVGNEVVQHGTRHSLAYRLENLEVATDYMAMLRVRNKYGWSSESDRFSFFTKKAMAVLQSTSGTGCRETAWAFLLLLLLALSLTAM
ncbi:protein amalgam-like isoform X1 [Portunus trituberculatus]|uniref:protein amalgam-like isoform X1 n=1 Tax=Portunus trituberculatus TaxID=210409 RepID=UPI001E1CF993|nr:protein amalgam-like isoform X1 [Portunus trituberculatus]XP_045113916.1 protein amalgam-like isoform X1 [Portunus trituberculatus]XP_045113917.1 protein amalgam-like isoform X1 [Portunus trituberculatus]